MKCASSPRRRSRAGTPKTHRRSRRDLDQRLTKRYKDVLAVDDVTLEVPNGSVCGLLGRNGAGKTTTFKCVLGFARADAGEIRFDGEPLTPKTFERLGYVPERPQLYPWMTVAQHVEVARHTQPAFDEARTKELARDVSSRPAKRAAKKLSKGQQTALALTVALSTNPSLLVLDEPASGLDPVLQRAVLDILIDAAQAGATILLSSHQIGQIDRAADRVAIMRDGKIVVAGEIDDLRAAAKVVEGTFEGGVPELSGLTGIVRIERAGTTLRAYANGGHDAIVARFGALGARGVRVLDRSLEDLFLDAVSDGGVVVMTYVAMLRGRRVLTRYAIFLACGLVLALAIIFSQHGNHLHVETSGIRSTHSIPLAAIVGGSAFAAYLVVTCLGANLDAEYRTAAIAWTRPLSRYAIALRFFAVDAGSAASPGSWACW